MVFRGGQCGKCNIKLDMNDSERNKGYGNYLYNSGPQ